MKRSSAGGLERGYFGNNGPQKGRQYIKYSRGPPASSIPRQLAALKARMPQRESKFIDITLTGTIDVSPTYFAWLTKIIQGVDTNQRIGNDISVKSLNFRFYVSASAASAPANGFNRFGLAVVSDKRPQINQPLWYSGTGSQAVMAQLSTEAMANRLGGAKRYKILKRWTGSVSNAFIAASGTNPAIPQTCAFEWYKKFKTPWKVRFATAGATTYSSDGDDNQLSLVAYSEGAGVTVPIVGYCRVTYYDD